MTLLSRDVLLVYPEVDGTDADGNPIRVAGVDPIAIRGHFGPASSGGNLGGSESERLGQVTNTLCRFVCRSFPAGAFGRADFEGREFDVVGDPLRFRGASRASRSVTVILRARGPEQLPQGA